jgi:hypothetical protein
MRRAGAVCVAMLVFCTQAAADEERSKTEFRQWTERDGGRQALARFVEVKNGQAILEREDGRLAKVEVRRLSDADQSIIASQREELNGKQGSNASSALSSAVTALSSQLRGAASWMSKGPTGWLQSRSGSDEKVPETRTASVEAQTGPVHLAVVRVSRPLIASQAEQQVARQEHVRDVIVSLPIGGTAFTHGSTRVELVPSRHQGVVDILFNGTTDANTSGTTRGVTIHSNSVTNFAARKRLLITPDGLQVYPTVSSARTETYTSGIDTSQPRLRGRIARRVASNQVAQSRGQANWESARSAERRVNAAFDREVDTLLTAVRPQIEQTLQDVAAVQADTGYQVRVSSTPMHLVVSVSDPHGDHQQLLPPVQADRPVTVQVHQSLLKTAMSNGRIQRLLTTWDARTEQGMLVSNPTGGLKMQSRWSRDGQWLTLEWTDRTLETEREQLAVIAE